MALSNKPQDDAKGMIDDYQHGSPISEIAERYNHTAEEVEAIVVKPVTEEAPVTEQVQEAKAEEPKTDTKKGK